ncbi:MAG TPA: hypothetical protein VKG89_05400 [Solirubrobacterales bacterium]|nr:hypothetical protein [Solirubrobacterales bacterium]
MGFVGRIILSLWIAVVGAIVMYVFFVTVASVSPREVARVTAVVAVLTFVFTLRSMRIANELADRGGDPALRRARNRARERRGF